VRRWIAISAASLVFALTLFCAERGVYFVGTWPGPSPYGGSYRATFAVQLKSPPEAGFLISCDDFTTFGRPGVMWIWNDEVVADWGGP
jgi:hypothetical protein